MECSVMRKKVSVGDSMASKCPDNDDNEDWETEIDAGHLAQLSSTPSRRPLAASVGDRLNCT